MSKSRLIKVIDNFIPNFEYIRPLIDRVSFGDHEHKGKTYTGFGPVTLPLKKLIEEEMGFMVEFQQSHIRIGRENTPLTHYIHADSDGAQFACVVYLNDPSCETGTMFWKHKATRLDRLEQPADPDLFELFTKHISDESHWDKLEYVEAKENRAVIFDAALFHSRYPQTLPITEGQTPRLVCTIFFNKIETPTQFRIQEWGEIDDFEDYKDAQAGNYFGLVCLNTGALVRVYLDHAKSIASCVFDPGVDTLANEALVATIVEGFTYRPVKILKEARGHYD